LTWVISKRNPTKPRWSSTPRIIIWHVKVKKNAKWKHQKENEKKRGHTAGERELLLKEKRRSWKPLFLAQSHRTAQITKLPKWVLLHIYVGKEKPIGEGRKKERLRSNGELYKERRVRHPLVTLLCPQPIISHNRSLRFLFLFLFLSLFPLVFWWISFALAVNLIRNF
jgi:hypothetical protein